MLATGSLVRVSSVASVLRAELLPGGAIILADSHGTGNLRVKPNGSVDTRGGRGSRARFWAERPDGGDESALRLQNAEHPEVFLSGSILSELPDAPQCGPETDNALAAGSLVKITSSAVPSILRAELLPDGSVILASSHAGNLRVNPNGKIGIRGGRGEWARFRAERPDGGDEIRLQSVGHPDVFLRGSVLPADPCPPPPEVRLSAEEKAAFVRDGFLVVRGVVGRELVDAALRAINHHLGQGESAWEADEDGKQALTGDIGEKRSPAIRNLLDASPVRGIAEQLVQGPLGPSVGGQVALRFPLAEEAKDRPRNTSWHVDGLKTDHISSFQLLVGVALSSQPDDGCGNLSVWPAQHGVAAEAVRRARRAPSAAAAPDDPWRGRKPALRAEDATPVLLEPGDVVLAHQKLPHQIGLNRSPHVRYQVYFRLSGRDYKPQEAAEQGLWENWRVGPE